MSCINTPLYPVVQLLCTEVPDVVTNFGSDSVGARWVSLTWTPGFNGNRDLHTLQVLITQPSSEDTRLLVVDITRQDMNRYG